MKPLWAWGGLQVVKRQGEPAGKLCHQLRAGEPAAWHSPPPSPGSKLGAVWYMSYFCLTLTCVLIRTLVHKPLIEGENYVRKVLALVGFCQEDACMILIKADFCQPRSKIRWRALRALAPEIITVRTGERVRSTWQNGNKKSLGSESHDCARSTC